MSEFATVDGVHEDGLTLIFDGEEAATEKHYKCNTSVVFSPGDRVRIIEDSGTFVVEYVVGAPKRQDTDLPPGGTAGQSLTKRSAADYDAAWSTVEGLPPSGAAGYFLKKKTA